MVFLVMDLIQRSLSVANSQAVYQGAGKERGKRASVSGGMVGGGRGGGRNYPDPFVSLF